MSKFVLVVDLLDDDVCGGCPLAGLCNHSIRVPEDESDRSMEFFYEMRGPTCPLLLRAEDSERMGGKRYG